MINKSHLQKGYRFTSCSPSCRGKFSKIIQTRGWDDDGVIKAIKDNLIREFKSTP